MFEVRFNFILVYSFRYTFFFSYYTSLLLYIHFFCNRLVKKRKKKEDYYRKYEVNDSTIGTNEQVEFCKKKDHNQLLFPQ